MKSTTTNLAKIGGLSFSYSVMCSRKLWLYQNNINLEESSENVKIGKSIEENYYKNEQKGIQIDGINIDYLKNGIVYEIKKSSKSLEFALLQIKYYLYFLEQKGIKNVTGMLKVPTEKYQKKIVLSDDDKKFIENQLEKINGILKGNLPKLERTKICSKCAYYEFCFVGE